MKIPFRGIVKNTPAGLAQDGELEDVVNLRYKDGAWRPIPDRSAIFPALPYTNVYIHSNSGYTHYLGLKSTGKFEYFAEDLNGTPTKLPIPIPITSLTTPTFTQIGNVININDNGLKYLIWYDNAYVLIDSNFDGAQDSTSLIGQVDLKVTIKEQTPRVYRSTTSRAYATMTAANTDIPNVVDVFDGLWIKAISAEKQRGALTGFSLACTAIQLFDGSYILHSAPVLLGQPGDSSTRYNVTLGGNEYKYNKEQRLTQYIIQGGIHKETGANNAPVIPFDDYDGYNIPSPQWILGVSPAMQYGIVSPNHLVQSVGVTGQYWLSHPNPDDSATNTYWTYSLEPSDINSYPFYTEHYFDDIPAGTKYRITVDDGAGGVRMYVVTRTSVRMPYVPTVNMIGYFNKKTSNSGYTSYPAVIVRGNKLQYKIPFYITENLRPLITSIGVFITPDVSMYKIDNKCERTASYRCYDDAYIDNYSKQIKTNEEIIKELAELRTFYKVHEIPFEQIVAGDWIDIDLKDKLGDALLTQEALPYDDFSHHSTLPQVAMTYNSKLHVANYKTLLSRGWPMNYFLPRQGIGQFKATTTQIIGSYMKWIKVKIKTNNGLSEVVRFDRMFGLSYESSNYFAPLLSYPDARATEITLYSLKITSGEVGFLSTKTFALTASKSNNFAYYIAPDLKPIDMSYSSTPIKGSLTQPPESNREQVYQNAMKVSEVNNPFTFPVQNTYQVGNGSITGIASNTIALSTGQFGEFPLYVFTTDGIWAMYVGGDEVNYTSSRPVSREVCNNPKSIKAIDTGVVFSTAKGIMVIAGSSTKELSEPIEGAVFDIDKLSLFKKALNHDKLTTLLSEVTGEDIHNYIASANVGYNYIESEIWFTNPLKSYSYVFSKGLWYKVKQTGNRFVDDYPKQYLLTNTGDLVDIASEVLITGSEGKERAASQQIMLLTRPLKFGDVEFKQMLTAIMRGQLTTVNLIEEATPTDILHKKWAGIHVYGSYDGERWVFLGGAEKQGELNDIGTRIERTDCRYYRIALYGNVSLNSYINYLEMDGKQSILRTKLR